jgi:hypothetical protein
VDLQADAAVGEVNLKRVVGSEGSRPGRRETLKGSPSSREVSTRASTAWAPKDREAVETARRES